MRKINRFNIIIIIIITLMSIIFLNLFYLQIIEGYNYRKKFALITKNTVYGETAPRGRIYDRNHKLLVDNIPVKVIYYKKNKDSKNKEIDISYKLADLIDVDYSKINENMKKRFWIVKNKEKADAKITDEELKDLSYRKKTQKDIEKLKLERITNEELNEFDERDLEAAYIYYLMNKGYSYTEKIIKSLNVSDYEYASIASKLNKLSGVGVKLTWERDYIYENTFKSIFGTVSSSEVGIPNDLINTYLKKGYELTDRVGSSYLELFYDDYLRGTKNEYKMNNDGSKTLIKKGQKGNDIVLTIDIELQKEVDNILTEEILKAKEEPNTDFYNRSFAIITNPKTGEILAMSGKQVTLVNGEYKVYDYTPGVITSSVVVGSVVKGASHIVGYNTGALTIGEERYDNCVKLKGAPTKCSWKYLGLLDDLKALKLSSNTYQFYTALKVAGVNYFYDMPFKIENNAFDIYRNTFKEFGLGVKTEIDLPNESAGLKGNNNSSGLLLDFSIGQYDNYTPMQLSQYISTIANNGIRVKPHLLEGVYESNSNLSKEVYKFEATTLNEVKTDKIYIDRVKEGFKQVMGFGGTGSGYINTDYKPAGKTGTSQSFVDTDGNGIVDTETVSNTFVAYAPYDDPIVTFTVVSPDTYNYDSSYQTYVNKRISKRISDKYFEIYK